MMPGEFSCPTRSSDKRRPRLTQSFLCFAVVAALALGACTEDARTASIKPATAPQYKMTGNRSADPLANNAPADSAGPTSFGGRIGTNPYNGPGGVNINNPNR